MGQIRVLPPGLVNRIAAGECVERPASVVKELIENSLDAGASRIEVSILDGGRELIKVADDGVGMDLADLELSVRPHATSKLASEDDLFNVHTLGFRGEALASIGAVARLRLTSRRGDSEVGYTIGVEAGQIGEPIPCAAAVGTTAEVRDLFYCVPARRKFLRSSQTEMGHITEQLARCALAHPGVAFTLAHQNRTLHELAATTDRRRRLADLFGQELADALLPVCREGGGVRVEGYVAPPAQCRRSGKWEYVFVNGRYVRDRFVGHALKAAYRSLIKPDEYPVAFLFITIDPRQVDVNVHPTKVEVRWQDSNYVHAQVLAAVRERFLSTNLDKALQPPPKDDEGYRERVRAAMVGFFTRSGPQRWGRNMGGGPTPGARTDQSNRGQEGGDPYGLPRAGAPRPLSISADQAARTPIASPETIPAAHVPPDTAHHCPPRATPADSPDADRRADPAGSERPRAMQVHNSYLVVETADGLMIVDQHALHERILYEELHRRISEKPLESQRLLLPVLLRVPADRIEALETHADLMARLGLSLALAGPQTVAVHGFPLLLEGVDTADFVRDLLDLLSERGERPNAETLIHDVLDMMACKAAVKAGDPLTPEEVTALLRGRVDVERTSHCPHGRPTTLRLSLRDLERQFKRR